MSSSTPNLREWPWPVVATPLSRLVRNAEATLLELQHPEVTLPVIVPDLHPKLDRSMRSWVACMESGMFGYILDELSARGKPTLIRSAIMKSYSLTGACGPWRRAVQVGNLPFSTTMRTPVTNRVLWEILPALREAMPDRPFAVRNVYAHRQELRLPEDATLIPARPIYRYDYSQGDLPNSSNFKRDLKLLAKSGLIEIGDHQFDEGRIREGLNLYQQLYRDKHSLRNPDYTLEMITLARDRGWLSLRGLVYPTDARLVSFSGVHEIEGTISAPLIGYDLSVPRKAGLYRQNLAQLAKEAIERRIIDDSSSGAGDFKRGRGLLPELEYLVIMPPLTGARRMTDRFGIRLQRALMRGVTLETMIAGGG